MANQIAEKLEALNCPENMRENAMRFSGSLTCISLEELKDIIDFLMEKGVVQKEENKLIISPGTFKILPRGLEFIKGRVAEMEEIGELDAYKEKLYRINIQDANLRILYMKEIGDPYKTEDGKYSMLLFNIRAFNKKYSNPDLSLVNTHLQDEQTDVVEVETTPVIEEVKNLEVGEVSTTNVNNTKDLEVESIIDEVKTTDETSMVSDFEEVPIMDIVEETQNNIIEEDRYNKLVGHLANLYRELFGMDNVPGDMLDCLKRFMEETDYNDRDLLYELLTSGSSYPDDAKTQIMDAIESEVIGTREAA